MTQTPEQISSAARQIAQDGDLEGAYRILADGLAIFANDARLLAQAASLAVKRQQFEEAVALYTRAVAASPENTELKLDLAIALTSHGDPQQALEVVSPLERQCAEMPRYWSIRANAARASGDLEQAAKSYERCLALKPDHPRAMHGIARVALERGDDKATQFFDRALHFMPSEADLWLGKAQALDAEGRSGEALDLARQLVAQAPQWIDALDLLAQLRSAAGDADFDSHFREAATRLPQHPDIPAAHIRLLTSRESYSEAASVAAEAARRFPSQPFFALSHAGSTGMAGELDEADRLFSALDVTGPERSLQEGRQRIRRGDYGRAEELLLEAASAQATTHTAYALLEFVWRLIGDERAHWLHGQLGLVRSVELPLGRSDLQKTIAVLDDLHDHSTFPVGQSLRGGTQTRHILFHRREPELQLLQSAIVAALEEYRATLPPADKSHPMLRHRDDPWKLAGSWS
ncbi:MAG: tetratricopeptide repeat protein, partial [Qipengyuania vulgaris]